MTQADNNSITTQDLRSKKSLLEQGIRDMIITFEKETSVNIERIDIDIDRNRFAAYGGNPSSRIVNINISLDI